MTTSALGARMFLHALCLLACLPSCVDTLPDLIATSQHCDSNHHCPLGLVCSPEQRCARPQIVTDSGTDAALADSHLNDAAPDVPDAGHDTSVADGCEPGDRRCDVRTPLSCDARRNWQREPSCTDEDTLCSQGVCSHYLVHGAFAPIAPPGSTAPSGYQLQEQQLGWPMQCGKVRGQTLCVRGGLGP